MWPALEKLIDPLTRGDPESPLRWTCKSTPALAAELFSGHGIRISDKTVAKLLREHGYSLQAPNKSVEGAQHPVRNAHFECINATAQDRIQRGIPVISVDTKKKKEELVGNFKNGGQEWQPAGEPELVDVHDFPGDAVGKAIPYGIYDVASNDGFVSVGVDHDTPVFAVKIDRSWWRRVGRDRYPNARELFITADAGGECQNFCVGRLSISAESPVPGATSRPKHRRRTPRGHRLSRERIGLCRQRRRPPPAG